MQSHHPDGSIDMTSTTSPLSKLRTAGSGSWKSNNEMANCVFGMGREKPSIGAGNVLCVEEADVEEEDEEKVEEPE